MKTDEKSIDALFKHSNQATKDLHKAAKKLIREKKRKEWWSQNGKKGGTR